MGYAMCFNVDIDHPHGNVMQPYIQWKGRMLTYTLSLNSLTDKSVGMNIFAAGRCRFSFNYLPNRYIGLNV